MTVPSTVGAAQRGLSEEQREVVVRNMPLVHHVVARLTERLPSSYARDDLLQAGALGLIDAARRFDPSLGYTFSTFAGRRIEGAVLDALRRADWASRSVRRGERLLREADHRLQASLGREPTDRELSAAMKVDVHELHALRADLDRARVESLNRTATDEREAAPEPVTTDESHRRLERQETIGYLRDAVSVLPERHRLVIVGHFLEGMTMTELGQVLGVTQSRASQLKSEALSMMRQGLTDAIDGAGSGTDDGNGTGGTGGTAGRQHRYNEAVRSASTWKERLGAAEARNDLTSL